MRKIVGGLFMSLDGVVEAPETWTSEYFSDEIGQSLGESMANSDAMLLGRRTYEVFADAWPGRGTEDPFAKHMNETPKFVVSTTLTSVEWTNSTLIKGSLPDELGNLKRQPGKNINLSGSATLTRSLLRDGLVDELGLLVFPMVVGSGSRLFPEGDTDKLGLKLVNSQTFSTGVLSLTYAPAGN
jgi:dihydrofolate reductase